MLICVGSPDGIRRQVVSACALGRPGPVEHGLGRCEERWMDGDVGGSEAEMHQGMTNISYY